tara:strand:- start:274 stop:444 length:171 start_codon:yes stop_codon:yes gene_type:complete
MKDKILNKYMKEGSSSIPEGAKKKIKDGLSMLVTKKHGGKITYKMTGGQVVDASYD